MINWDPSDCQNKIRRGTDRKRQTEKQFRGGRRTKDTQLLAIFELYVTGVKSECGMCVHETLVRVRRRLIVFHGGKASRPVWFSRYCAHTGRCLDRRQGASVLERQDPAVCSRTPLSSASAQLSFVLSPSSPRFSPLSRLLLLIFSHLPPATPLPLLLAAVNCSARLPHQEGLRSHVWRSKPLSSIYMFFE